MDFDGMRQWYDGYSFGGIPSVYNPNSVMRAIMNGKLANYRTQTETYESLKQYIVMNMDGLKDAVVAMLVGISYQKDGKDKKRHSCVIEKI